MYGETCNHSSVSESWGGGRWPLSRVSMEEGGQGDAQGCPNTGPYSDLALFEGYGDVWLSVSLPTNL